MKRSLWVFASLALLGFCIVAVTRLGLQDDGRYLVSSGQYIELLGISTKLEGLRPKDLAVSPDKKLIAILTHRRLIVADIEGTSKADLNLVSAGALGVAWSPDGSIVYASLASGRIAVLSWDGSKLTRGKDINPEPAGTKGNPATTGLVVTSDGTIYAALSIRNKVVSMSPTGEILLAYEVGACPYHLAVSPDQKTISVANRGGTVVAPSPEQGDPESRGAFQGTGVANAQSAGTAVQIDPRTDAALTGTISLIQPETNTVKPIQVGRQPSGMTFSEDGKTLYVTNSDEDSVSVVDVVKATETSKISLTSQEDPGFGQIPTDVALTQENLFVTLGGGNAVAVIDRAKGKLLGYFPTAWYPIAIRIEDGKYIIASAKGIGSRPFSKKTGFGVHDNVGIFQTIEFSEVKNLHDMTQRVAKNNAWSASESPRPGQKPVPVPERVGEPSVFTHVVYIIKENLTYDIALGDMKEGNGDPSLCTFPEEVTPNQHALARRFGLLDNFYISGTNSADGHQWVDSAIANGYTEQNYAANTRSYPYDGGDPLAFSPAGFLWTPASSVGKSVRVFGEFVDKPVVNDKLTGKAADWQRCWADYKSKKDEVEIRAVTSQAALRKNLHPTYIGFPSSVSDQWRVDTFLGEFKTWESSGKMPDLTIMLLPNDHTVGTRANWPTPRAMVADNDLALGRIVEAITASKFWEKTLIIVAEDDSQTGFDHIDGHRSVALCISPYSRKGETISDFVTHVTIASTISHVLGVPPMTRFDRTARPMFGCFDDAIDLTPFKFIPNKVPLDELNPPAKSLPVETRRLSEACSKMDWDELDTQDQNLVNRAIWGVEADRSVGKAGYSADYPTLRHR